MFAWLGGAVAETVSALLRCGSVVFWIASVDGKHDTKWVPAENRRHNFTQMPHRKRRWPATRWDDDSRSLLLRRQRGRRKDP